MSQNSCSNLSVMTRVSGRQVALPSMVLDKFKISGSYLEYSEALSEVQKKSAFSSTFLVTSALSQHSQFHASWLFFLHSSWLWRGFKEDFKCKACITITYFIDH